ncbi:SLC13 family permease [uncultured Cocleimonas sp.]|uniref:SLC13 family permease n=1 Tax=uncultured Cocleimonas sp. TaxID=1051587 RepID=UPI002632EBFB|nr:SLC13 family permease [uncultured Cocleimonas sp.]
MNQTVDTPLEEKDDSSQRNNAFAKKDIIKKVGALAIFALLALYLASISPTITIAWVVVILVLTIYLFVFEIVDIDVAAISIMVLLGLTSLLAPIMGLEEGLVDTKHLFDGFSSNAVMSIIAVMIIGAGLDKTGIMSKVSSFILNIGGTSEGRIIPIISSTVAIISSFMQNVGAAALFLPVVSKISSRSNIPMSRLLMPMGFCAILGGTVTMVGSSPLILLNDLIETSNIVLPEGSKMELWSLFSTTPVGLALVATGILYFVIFGKLVLPATKETGSKNDDLRYFEDVYGLRYTLHEVVVGDQSLLIGKNLDDIETEYKIRVVATKRPRQASQIGPGAIDRDTSIEAKMVLAIISESHDLKAFLQKYDHLEKRKTIKTFADDLSPSKTGIAEVLIPPSSNLIGKSARDVWLRKTYGTAMIGLHRNGETLHEGDDIRSIPFQSGDTLVVYTPWEALMRIENSSDFVVINKNFPHEEVRPKKIAFAAIFFFISLYMVLFTDIRLSIALLTGATGMILTGVLNIDEAYRAVSWKTVFLLASLIPLGIAVEHSGTAKWIAEQTLSVVGHMPIWVIQTAVAILATFFTLVMSNVGATVLLVPLAVNIAIGVGANPAVFALTVAIATSNSFLIPTHQVNALIMGPGGYRVPDFMKAGGIMTLLFLVVMIVMMNLIY